MVLVIAGILAIVAIFCAVGSIEYFRVEKEVSWEMVTFALVFGLLSVAWPFVF